MVHGGWAAFAVSFMLMLVAPGAAVAADPANGDGAIQHPPVAAITAPSDQSTYRDGVAVSVAGSATDVDGPVGSAGMHWKIVRFTGRNFEIVAEADGETATFTPSDRWGADTTYEARLTVTDSTGLSDTASITLVPETVKVTLRSEPVDAVLTYGKLTQSGSQVFDDVIGHRVALSAPDTAGPAGGQALVFDSWSDGGDRSHDFVVPATPVELVAQYRAPQLDVAAPEVEAGAGMGGGEALRGDASALPALSLDAPDPFTLKSLSGWLRRAGSSTAPLVQLALRRGGAASGCAWWNARNGRFTASSRSACHHPRFISASMRRTSGGWRWRVALGRSLPAGSYAFVAQVLGDDGTPLSFVRR